MSHEVRALARFPGRSRLLLGAALAFGLGAWAYGWPMFVTRLPEPALFELQACQGEVLPEACEEVLPQELRELPSPHIVEQICLTTLARGLVDHPGAQLGGDVCGEELLRASSEEAVSHQSLTSFVDHLSGWEPLLFAPSEDLAQERLRSSALAEAAWSAKQVASRYQAVREAHVAQEYREAQQSSQMRLERWKQGEAMARTGRTIQGWLVTMLGLATLALTVAFWLTRPVMVVLSPGRVRLGARSVSLEEVMRWDFRSPILSLTDGTHLQVGFGRELAPEDRLVMDEAMELAMGRVSAAAPLDRAALHAVRELAR